MDKPFYDVICRCCNIVHQFGYQGLNNKGKILRKLMKIKLKVITYKKLSSTSVMLLKNENAVFDLSKQGFRDNN